MRKDSVKKIAGESAISQGGAWKNRRRASLLPRLLFVVVIVEQRPIIFRFFVILERFARFDFQKNAHNHADDQARANKHAYAWEGLKQKMIQPIKIHTVAPL
jgi:hypothetical protein